MSGQAQADQVEAQAAQVEQESHREDIRESKVMDSKLLAPKFNANPRLSAQAFSKAIDDEKRSVASGQSPKALSPALFFESATAKSDAEIDEAVGTGDYQGFDKGWDFWLSSAHPNSKTLSPTTPRPSLTLSALL
jgi:hypothetical protein